MLDSNNTAPQVVGRQFTAQSPKKQPSQNDTLTLFVEIQTTQKTITCELTANATVQQLRADIFEQANLSPESQKANLILDGRILPYDSATLNASSILRSHVTLKLADGHLIGGSRWHHDDDDYKSADKVAAEHEKTSTSKVDPQPVSARRQEPQFEDKADNVMATANEMFGFGGDEPPGLSNEWANVPAYVEQLLENQNDATLSDMEVKDKALAMMRHELICIYRVPQLNEGLSEIQEVISIWTQKLEAVPMFSQSLNNVIRQLASEFKQKDENYLTQKMMHLFLKKLSRELDLPINDAQVISFAKSMDTDGDGVFDMTEIVRPYTKEERKAWFASQRNLMKEKYLEKKENSRPKQEEEAPVDEDQQDFDFKLCIKMNDYHEFTEEREKELDEQEASGQSINVHERFYGESCFSLLPRLLDEKKKRERQFQERMSENKPVKKIVDELINRLSSTEPWYEKLNQSQKDLIEAIMTEQFKTEQMAENLRDHGDENRDWCSLQSIFDSKTILHLIFALGPDLYEESIIVENVHEEAESLLDIVHSAKCAGMLKILMDRVDQMQRCQQQGPEIKENFTTYFHDANLPQKRLMLTWTKSQSLKSIWLENLSACDVLKVARPTQSSGEIDCSLLALCSDEKLAEITIKLTDKETKQFTLWKLMNSIGLPRDSPLSIQNATKKEQLQSIVLPIDTKYCMQIPRPGFPGYFLRVERQSNSRNATFRQNEEEIEKNKDSETGFVLVLLMFVKQSNQLEVYSQKAISQPRSIKTGSTDAHARPILFTGQSKEVFWFSKSQNGTMSIEILDAETDEVNSTEINKESQLHFYLANEAPDFRNQQIDKISLPQAEPTLINLKGKLNIVYSFFKLGGKPSVCFYCIEKSRDMFQLSGANMFLQVHTEQDQQIDQLDQVPFILYADPETCTKVISSLNDLEYLEDPKCVQIKRFVLDVKKYYSSDERQVVDFMEDYDSFKDKYGEQIPRQMRQALISDNSDWICTEGDKINENKAFRRPGSFKIISHVGRDQRKFFAMQNTTQKDIQLCVVYEVIASNNLKMIFSSNDIGHSQDEILAYLVSQEPNTDPKLMFFDWERKTISQIDILSNIKVDSKSEEEKTEKSDKSEQQSECDYSSEREDQDHQMKAVYTILLPADYTSKFVDQDDELKALYPQQPYLSDGVLLTGLIDIEGTCADVLVKELAQKKKNANEDDDTSSAQLYLTENNAPESWVLEFNYPILACVNKNRSGELIVAQMASGTNEQLLFKLNFGQFICFVKLSRNERTGCDIGFLAYDQKKKKTFFYHLALTGQQFFQKGSLLKAKNWRQIRQFELKGKFEKLPHIKDSIKSVKFFDGGEDETIDFGLLIQTKQEVLFMTEKNIQIVFQQKGDQAMYHTDMIYSQSGKYYFVTEEVSSQTNSLQEIQVKRQEATHKFEITCKQVYTFSTGQILQIQLNQDTEQEQSQNYTWQQSTDQYTNELESSDKCITDLMVIDTSLHLFKLQQIEAGQPFQEISSRNLSKVDHLKSLPSRKSESASIIMSERALILKENVMALDSDIRFDALQDHFSEEGKKVIASELVPKSDKIMFTVQDSNCLELVFKRDPSRRNCNIIGHEGLRDCCSANVISKDLLLVQIRCSEDQTFWAYASPSGSGSVRKVPDQISTALERFTGASVKSRIVKGNVCQLVFFCQEINTDEERFNKNEVRNSTALVMEISSDGDYLRHKELCLKNPKVNFDEESEASDEAEQKPKSLECEDTMILQNQQGKLLQVIAMRQSGDCATAKECEPEIFTAMKKNEEGEQVNRPMQVVLTHSWQKPTDYLYSGNYLCWCLPNESQIRALDITDPDGKGKVKIFDFDNYRGDIKAHLVGLNECSLQSAVRMAQTKDYNEKVLSQAANHIQLTIGTFALLIDLNKDEPVPVSEIAAMQQLDDPQNYVDCGMTLETIQERESKSWINEDLQVHTEGSKFGLKRWYEPQPHGNLVMLRQSANLPTSKTYLTDEWIRPVLGIYQNCCELDIMQARQLIHCADTGIKPKKIDLMALWASYGDDILLAHLQGNLRVLTAIKDYIEGLELESLEDEDGLETYNPALRRLSDMLVKKTYLQLKTDGTELELQSYLSRSLSNSGLRDAILKIGRLSPNFSVFKIFQSQDDFGQIVEKSTPQTTAELESCLVETRSTRQIQLLDWPRELDLLTLRSNKCTISKEELDNELEDHENKVTRAVNVTTLNMSFFFHDRKNFIAFTQMLQRLPNQVYASIFIESILDQFWESTQNEIIKFNFIPYLLFVVSTLWFFVTALSHRQIEGDESETHANWQYWVLGGTTFLLWCNQMRNELHQIVGLKNKCDYFTDMWNINDFVSLVFTLIIVLTSVEHEPLILIEHLRAMAAVASCTLMIKVFDWLRLFENTAFYILLVQETMKDIKAFLILLLTTLMMFGIPMVMLDLNRTEENALVDATFGFWGFNLLLNQYMLALGEFNMDNFADQPQALMCFFFFISATFITQITMFNMLIAIMGDTFERVMENKEVNATQTKLELMSDLVASLQQTTSTQEENVYLFVAKPDDDEGNAGEDWEGTVNKMTRITASHIKNLGVQLHKKNDKLQDSIDDFVKKDQTQDKHLKAHIDKVTKASQREVFEKINNLEHSQDEMKHMLSQIVEQLDQKKQADQ